MKFCVSSEYFLRFDETRHAVPVLHEWINNLIDLHKGGNSEETRGSGLSKVVSILNKTQTVHKAISHFQRGPKAQTFVSQPYKWHGHFFYIKKVVCARREDMCTKYQIPFKYIRTLRNSRNMSYQWHTCVLLTTIVTDMNERFRVKPKWIIAKHLHLTKHQLLSAS
jgi:hypothetical protein